MTRDRAWCSSGARLHQGVPRDRGTVLTTLGALTVDGLETVMTNIGATTGDVFLWRHLRVVAELPERDQRAVLRLIDTAAT